MLNPVRIALKGAGIAVVIIAFILVAYPGRSRRRKARVTYVFSRLALWIFGVRSHVENGESLRNPRGPALVLSNHLSYLDVLVLAAQAPACFVTSVEVKEMGFLGLMARCAGSVFVERRSRATLMDDIQSIARVLGEGMNVVIFPEGTTGDGRNVLPFKKSLCACATETLADVLPVCLNYAELDGTELGGARKDEIFYYGDMEFFSHLRRLLSVRSIAVNIHPLERVEVSRESCRKRLADAAFRAIRSHYVPIG